MRVMVVEDDYGSRLVAEASVRGLGHECVSAQDGDQAWRMFDEFAPDVVVTDRVMPGLQGLELCRRIRSLERYTYVVIVTSLVDRVDVLDGMNAGADEYLCKPLNPFDLERRLLAARRVIELHAELALTRAQLAKQASTDSLTGLQNRLGLPGDHEHLHGVSQRYGRSYAVALCDVDLMKKYNDTYGFPAGDEVLSQIGLSLRASLRDVDRIYRYGGEEFLLLLPEQTGPGAERAVQRALDALRELALEHRTGGATGTVTMSVGVAVYTPGQQLTSQALLAHAEEALYAAKAAGRDRVAFAHQSGLGPAPA